MAYYKLRFEVWCDWNPEESELKEIAQNIGTDEAICTKRELIAVDVEGIPRMTALAEAMV